MSHKAYRKFSILFVGIMLALSVLACDDKTVDNAVDFGDMMQLTCVDPNSEECDTQK